jgi:Rho-binding antiterminator
VREKPRPRKLERCDFLDVLEESSITGRNVAVTLLGGEFFLDGVKDVVTQDGEDWAVFRDHAWVAVSDIEGCIPARPRPLDEDLEE